MSILFDAAGARVFHASEKRLRTLPAVVAVSALMLLCAHASAQERNWAFDKVARGSTSSIAVDADQSLHLTYLTREARMYYALRPAGASRWFSMVVVDSTHANTNVWPRVVADKQGRPHMCVAFGVLLYVTLANHKWVAQHIDPGSGTISYHCSIAVGSDGTPHVGWYHEFLPGGTQYSHFRHADVENGVWMVRSVDGGISGKWSSMVVDSKGFPHATYSQFAHGGDLRYAEWDGSNWILTTVDSNENAKSYRGFDNSLALAPDDSPHISYFDGRTLKYAHQNRGKWIIEKVDMVAPGFDYYSGSTTMVLDSTGKPHIIYGDFGAIKHAFWDGKKWRIETIVSGAVQQYANVDAAFGANDTLYVSYPDPDDGYVKIAVGKLTSSAQVTQKEPKESKESKESKN
jgi:hypothetical protein